MKKPMLLLLAGTMLASLSSGAHAQRQRPDHSERRETFHNQMETMAPEQRLQFLENLFNERLKTATPEQREEMWAVRADVEKKVKAAGIDTNAPNAFQKMRDAGIFEGQKMRDAGIFEGMGGGQNGQDGGRGNRASNDAMKQMMEAASITDFDVQDAIVAYVAEQNKARATLIQLAQTAATALQRPVVQPINAADTGAVSTADAKVAITFSAYENAVKADNARQEKALKALDAKINYSGTPRIKAFLTLVGILNNDVLAIGGPAAIFMAPQQAGAMEAGMGG